MKWDILERETSICRLCKLSEIREEVILGQGAKKAQIMFVFSRADEEDKKLLNHALASLSFNLEDIYVTSLIKCSIPLQREIQDEEYRACLDILRSEFSLIRPKFVICLGPDVASYLISKQEPFMAMRGQWINKKGTYFLASYGPEDWKDTRMKLSFFEDLKKLKEKTDEIN